MFRLVTQNPVWNRTVLNDFMDDFFTPVTQGLKLDVSEDQHAYHLTADVPGVKKDQLTIAYDNEVLTLEVNVKDEEETEDKNYLRKERRRMHLKRSLHLPHIDAQAIKAKLEDGILSVTVPKMAPVDTRILIDVE